MICSILSVRILNCMMMEDAIRLWYHGRRFPPNVDGGTTIYSKYLLKFYEVKCFEKIFMEYFCVFSDPNNIQRDSVREPSPASSGASPRAPTPKRAPPPLVYSNNQSSPPIVAIAPTQSHNSHGTNEGRKVS